ncbi:INO80 complex subunit C-like [Haliotis asinina]|uniref:INO80 complex subunit C-like n=1 Tax=Haliotis asinina TaxID=109174 RepID=UPI0035324CD4
MASTGKSRKSRSKNSSPGATPSKKKRPGTPGIAQEGELPVDLELSTPAPIIDETPERTPAVFKDPNFIHSSKGAAGNKKTRIWKNLKQIIAAERSLPWQPNDVTYGGIDAPPSFKPAKKYSDLSGLQAPYTDPQTKMRYATAEEFTRARMLPGDLVTGYLALRKANPPVP